MTWKRFAILTVTRGHLVRAKCLIRKGWTEEAGYAPRVLTAVLWAVIRPEGSCFPTRPHSSAKSPGRGGQGGLSVCSADSSPLVCFLRLKYGVTNRY